MEIEARDERRTWSWAASEVEVEARRQDANQLVGERIRAVSYFMIDYRREELHPEMLGSGPRSVSAELEWHEPTWLYDGFDSLDYGFQVTTDSGAEFSLTWDPPGDREGIGLQRLPMLGGGVRRDADLAIWSVGDRAASWTSMVGRRVLGVDLHYRPWDVMPGSLWCPHITLHGEDGRVEIVMGESRHDALVFSSDNVAVLHPGSALPAWLSLVG